MGFESGWIDQLTQCCFEAVLMWKMTPNKSEVFLSSLIDLQKYTSPPCEESLDLFVRNIGLGILNSTCQDRWE